LTLSLLSGITVLDLTGEPAALAGRIMCDLGADVVMVEPPGGGASRLVAPLVAGHGGAQVSPHFAYTAAGKRSVTLDEGAAEGRELLHRLLVRCDVALVSEDSDTLRSRGLDYPSLSAVNPGLVYGTVTPFGSSGPRRRWAGSDLVAWASSGGLITIGEADRRPLAPGGDLAFTAGSLNLVAGVVLALRARRASGFGQMVDISLQEAVLSVTMESGPLLPLEGATQARIGARRAAAQGHFPTTDGFVELLPFMPGQWDALAEWISEELGIEEATMDTFKGSVNSRAPFAELIDSWVEQLSRRYTKQDFFVEAQRRAIPCGPVNEPADVLTDPHLEAVHGWLDGDLPSFGPARWPRPPLRFDGQPMGTGKVPMPGEHNGDVYGALGLSASELARLQGTGVI
jgi:crotonobetainyl-CoA:carnitine CoA-transferase CaiB-like acyl-CoA transferase